MDNDLGIAVTVALLWRSSCF